ncbi:tetratricopeptide repeat protein [Dendronalium sp. ChiSLP03b]|uniref:tetratricopeptide repeat protein n=1 Tax=Dendronalium sp. ChiSLP03b TaxID=3075381 RepID=UPI002AD1DFDB|nr:tetratricopeptide repeat protein [Dendronalium sp. ChiSLP03b]MDZ8204139.1 tetratricopeptide repeat protein [Dendronalium sp. ChiSLP03b]
MSVNDTAHSDNFAWNRQVYHRLKLALSLDLRRQIFLAVCDDLHLRNQVAARLHSTLAYPVGQILYQPLDGQATSTPAYPRLVTLRLNLSEPNPIAQINQWLANYPPPIVGASKDTPGRPLPIPTFQIVGVEQLTKQPVAVQRLFLHNLRLSEQYFSSQEFSRFLESSLLLWVSRPWLSAIQQSAPQFWRWRTGIFVFAGEPTPTTHNSDYPERFSTSRSLDLGNFEQSILEESAIEAELKEAAATNLKFADDFNLSSEIPTTAGRQETAPANEPQQQEYVANRASENKSLSLSSLSYVSKELAQLVTATINPKAEDREDNWQPQEILLQIEELHSQEASQETLAAAYHQLGNLYRLRIEQGQSTIENLMVAILAYQEAIAHDEASPQLPDILNDLGTLYWMLYRTPHSSEEGQTYIEQGIEFYQLALKLISPQTHAETYARVQNNLGTAYGDLARFSHPAENWQQAVSAYSEALRYRTAETDPLKYAACQNNLGTAYWHLAQYHQPIVHLQQAIASYNEALAHYSPEQEPLKYGMIQNNIGTAYWNLAQYEQPAENLRLAIDVYREALKYRTPVHVPSACAATQNNLGTAYWHLANLSQTTKDVRQKLLQLCISAYEEAIALAHSLNSASLSFDVFAAHNNLGLAHYQLVTDNAFNGDKAMRSQHLEAALDNHLQALNGLNQQPEAYQTTFAYVVKTIRAFHSELGIQGQNLALSKVPSQLLPEILTKL